MREKYPSDLATSIEDNLYNLLVKAARLSGNQVMVGRNISWVRAEESDWPNRIFKAKFENQTATNEVTKITQGIQSGILPQFWSVGPLSSPANLEELLLDKGFIKYSEQSGMAAKLGEINTKMPELPNFEVRVLKNSERITEWSQTIETVFGYQIKAEILEKLVLENDLRFYAGFINNQLVATSLLFLSSSVAGLHFVTTLPEYRKKSIGTAMTVIPLVFAYGLGYEFGILQASPMGEGVYQRIGFKEYFKLNTYKWN